MLRHAKSRFLSSKWGGPPPCSTRALPNTTATSETNVILGVDLNVMRIRIADLKLWSASDRHKGGEAVPIKEQCLDMTNPSYVNPVSYYHVVSALLHGGVGRRCVNMDRSQLVRLGERVSKSKITHIYVCSRTLRCVPTLELKLTIA